jgi:anti-sigma regulatory factor (Ser/Thr protein kinase)
MNQTQQLTAENTLASVSELIEFISAELKRRDVSAQTANTARIALEEILTNIVKYGYDDNESHVIEVRFQVDEKFIGLTVIDDGHHFNPLEAPPPDLSLPLAERPIGGVGIHLIRKLVKRIDYRREDDRNIITLVIQDPLPVSSPLV